MRKGRDGRTLRIARLSQKLQGKRLARTLISADGRPLLVAGTVLTSSFIRRLAAKGYRFVYVDDCISEGIESDDIMDDVTRMRALSAVHEALQSAAERRSIDPQRISETVEDLIHCIESSNGVVKSLITIRSLDEYTFMHSLNVCVLSLIVATAMGISREDRISLGVGALLHDVGKVVVPLEILNKPRELSVEEMAIVKVHTLEGFEILRSQPGISLLSAHVAFQHHERMDGQGYPRGLRGQEIHLFARIAAAADVMDALTAGRPYRDAFTAADAAKTLRSMAGDHLDAECVSTLVSRVAHYPAGTLVRLSTGDLAIVARQAPSDPSRPVVHVIGSTPSADARTGTLYELDLSAVHGVSITEALGDFPPVP